MNEIEKAIKYMLLLIDIQLAATRAMIYHNGRKKLGKGYLKEMGQKVANYKLAISALEKQMPFKPAERKGFEGKCKCGVVFLDRATNYCGNCGQKLNWEEQ